MTQCIGVRMPDGCALQRLVLELFVPEVFDRSGRTVQIDIR